MPQRTHTLFCLILVAAASLLPAACSSDGSDNPTPREGTLQFTNSPERWTYVSLQTGLVVGSHALGDTTAERSWRGRTDWDVAFAGDLIRTNGGTSGAGQAAITATTADYDAVDRAANEADYQTDRDTVAIW